MTTVHSDEMPFSLDWLVGAVEKKPAVSYCELGHLVVNDNTHWSPVRFAETGRALWCRIAEHPSER